MNHARVKALKRDGKTVSRKAVKSGRASTGLTPRNSPMASMLTSPSHSAAPSRVASDISDDDDDLEADFDDMSLSVRSGGSLPEIIEDGSSNIDAQALVSQLQDRKHSNSELREHHLGVLIRLLRSQYSAETHDWLDAAAADLAQHLLRDGDRGATARERFLNLQAYCLLVGTAQDLDIFESGFRVLKQIINDEDDDDCRSQAITALCMTVLYGGGAEEAALELMEFFVDVVQSDGEMIQAYDNGPIVAAILQGWAFTASHVSDFSDYADVALDAFVDQLDGGDADVQATAAFCIALIFESSRNHEEETGEPFQLGYDPHRLADQVGELLKVSAKSVSRKGRRELRENLTSVITSLDRGVGPFYSTALYIPDKESHVPASQLNDNGQAEYGHRCKIRIGSNVAKITTWSLLSRFNVMKGIFGGGLHKHIFSNPIVMECLDDAHFQQGSEVDASRAKGRKR